MRKHIYTSVIILLLIGIVIYLSLPVLKIDEAPIHPDFAPDYHYYSVFSYGVNNLQKSFTKHVGRLFFKGAICFLPILFIGAIVVLTLKDFGVISLIILILFDLYSFILPSNSTFMLFIPTLISIPIVIFIILKQNLISDYKK